MAGSDETGGGGADGSDTSGGADGPDESDSAGGSDDESSPESTAVLTSLLAVGDTATRGTVLYTADDEPVVSLIGDLPAWRTLEEGIDNGPDVRQLEQNLSDLGFDPGDTDETFTADTAAAVEDWETDLDRAEPDGTVTIGDVVFLPAPGDVLGHESVVGDTLRAGTPVLTLGSEQRIVVADVDVLDAGGWTAGSPVVLSWADGTTGAGVVFSTGKDVSDGQVELVVALTGGAEGVGDRRSGAAVEVDLTDATRDDVLAVPIAAITTDGHDGPAVRVARPGEDDAVVSVDTGLVASAWIEITTGLTGDEKVRLPG